jgi:hypothetical protein
MSGIYGRSRQRPQATSAPATLSPWVRATGRVADVDIRVVSNRTDDGRTITQLLDRRGKSLRDGPIEGEPGREDQTALVIAETIAELLRRG